MGPLHIHPAQVLAPDLDELGPPPSLMDPVHNPLRDTRLPHLQPLLQPYPRTPQPLQLLCRNRQLRDRRHHFLRTLFLLLLLLSAPQMMESRDGGPRSGFGDRVLGGAPARIDGVADAALGELVRSGDEDLAGGARAGRGPVSRLGGVVGDVAEAPELLGDPLDGGFG